MSPSSSRFLYIDIPLQYIFLSRGAVISGFSSYVLLLLPILDIHIFSSSNLCMIYFLVLLYLFLVSEDSSMISFPTSCPLSKDISKRFDMIVLSFYPLL